MTVLTKVSLQENVWSFLLGGRKKVAVITSITEVGLSRGSTLKSSVTYC